MARLRILMIGTYPIASAHHGGQKRTRAIKEAYEAAGFEVRYVAVFRRGNYPRSGSDDLIVTESTEQLMDIHPHLGDVYCGEAIWTDEVVRPRLAAIIHSFKPDAIEIEQVYGYLGLKPLLTSLTMSPKLIYSSHNIEYAMKRHILEQAEQFDDEAVAQVAAIEQAERELAAVADVVVAVSPADAKTLAGFGAKRVVLARNGINPLKPNPPDVSYWQHHFARQQVGRFGLFVASYHPPNWEGFLEYVSDRVGFVPPESRIVIAGGVGRYFKQSLTQRRPVDRTFWRRVEAVGELSEARLQGLIASASAILLPIASGGGSNLKTAEALISGRAVVGTEAAFRAFEEFASYPGVYIAKTPEAFRAATIDALSVEPVRRSIEQQVAIEAVVLWPACLRPLVSALKEDL